jgi:hypothetical protein
MNTSVKISNDPGTDQALIGRKPMPPARSHVARPDPVAATAIQNLEWYKPSINRKLPVQEAANFLGLSKSWLDKKRLDGGGPEYLKLGRRVVYDICDLESWAVQNRRRHTSE